MEYLYSLINQFFHVSLLNASEGYTSLYLCLHFLLQPKICFLDPLGAWTPPPLHRWDLPRSGCQHVAERISKFFKFRFKKTTDFSISLVTRLHDVHGLYLVELQATSLSDPVAAKGLRLMGQNMSKRYTYGWFRCVDTLVLDFFVMFDTPRRFLVQVKEMGSQLEMLAHLERLAGSPCRTATTPL